MTTLSFNLPQEQIMLDAQSASWLTVIERNSDKQKTCMVPKLYFEVLQTWGLVDGTFAAAKLSPQGRARLVTERAQLKEPKKSGGKKKK